MGLGEASIKVCDVLDRESVGIVTETWPVPIGKERTVNGTNQESERAEPGHRTHMIKLMDVLPYMRVSDRSAAGTDGDPSDEEMLGGFLYS